MHVFLIHPANHVLIVDESSTTEVATQRYFVRSHHGEFFWIMFTSLAFLLEDESKAFKLEYMRATSTS